MAIIQVSRQRIAFIRQILATLSASWTCVSHGLLSGYTAQAIPSLMTEDSTVHLTKVHISWISSIAPLVAVLSGPLSPPLCSWYGRRKTMMIACLPMCIGWFIITYASDANMILVGRGLTGVASAIGIPAAYTYVAEISSSQKRGFLGSALSIGWCFGLVISYSIGSVLEWNWLALTSSIVPLIQFVVLWVGTSSPRWLVSRKRYDDAKESLAFFRGGWNQHVDCELKDMQHQCENGSQSSLFSRLKMLVRPGIRKAVILCMAMFFFTMMTGFSIVNFHAKVILMQANVTSAINPNLGIIIMGSCGMFGNIISSILIDKVGRKTLLYVSCLFLCFAQASLGTYFYFNMTLPDDAVLADYRWVPLALLIIFVVFFPIGWGSVTYIVVSEMVPTSVRTETSVLCNSWEQLLSFIILRIHSAVCGNYGPQYLHWGSAVFMVLGAIFVFACLPETANKTLEEIEIFFVHIRREAMDIIGDNNACSEIKGRKISLHSLTDSVKVERENGTKKPDKKIELKNLYH